MNPNICFFDAEASGLQIGSFPIEVGWSSPEFISESFLICPAPQWEMREWRRTAELIHGISMEDCTEHGLSVFEAADRLNQALSGKAVYSDSPDYDGYWLQRLYETAEIQPAFPLKLLNLETLIRDTLRERGKGDWWADIDDLSRHVGTQYPRTHRAEADARHLAAMYRAAREGT